MSTPVAAPASSFDSRDLLPVFNALPGAYLLLSPALLIEAASDEYLAATLTTRAQLVGQFLFDAFPDNPAAPEAHATHNLRASLAHVLATGQLHEMAPQHYDVPDPAHPSHFVERHWRCTNRPVRDANDQVVYLLHTAVDITDQRQAERILHDSQAAEQAARAETEAQRQRFYEVLMQLPAYVAVYHGPDHVYQLVNPPYQSMFPHRSFLGRPFREGIPEAEEMGVVGLFDRVYQTGEPYYAHELEGWFDFQGNGEPEQVFLNLSLHPLRNAQGCIDGILDYSSNVTEQVRARQQVEQLNAELEARVLARTQEAEAAHTDAERQRVRLASVFRQAPAAIAVYGGPDFVFELVNPVYQALLPGRPLRGLPVRDAFPEVAELPVFNTLRQVYDTGVTHHEQDQLIPVPGPDGTLENRYFNFTLQARYDEQHRVDGVVGFGFETTAQVVSRRQAETLQAELLAAAQRQAHEREAFYQVFEQTPALIQLLRSPGHRVTYVNPAYQALFAGRPLVGRDLADALPELRTQGFIDLMDHVYRTGETYVGVDAPFMVPARDDQPAHPGYFSFTYQAFRENGQIAGLSVFAFDVTEQVLARQQVAASAQRLRLLTDALPVLIGYLDRERRYQFANEAYRAWFNQDPAALLGRKVREIVGEQAYAATSGYMDRALAGERFDFDATMPYREGFTRHIHTNYIPDVQQGAVQGFYTLVTDITEQVEARQQVERLNQELAAINEELTASNEELGESNRQLTRTNVDLDTFVYTASHDLKAPITNIESITQALRDTLPPAVQQDETIAHLLDLLAQTTTRFQTTIGQLTDLSKLQLAHAGPAEPVYLAAVVESVRLDLAPAIGAAEMQLTVEVAPDLVVSFSPANLRSAIYNLLSNAVKYRALDRPAQVQVRAYSAGPRVVLAVQDNGLGLNAHQQSRLFGLFQRLHTHVEGTGVGLYITKRLVENGGGTIAVESQVDVGTTFTLTFPA